MYFILLLVAAIGTACAICAGRHIPRLKIVELAFEIGNNLRLVAGLPPHTSPLEAAINQKALKDMRTVKYAGYILAVGVIYFTIKLAISGGIMSSMIILIVFAGSCVWPGVFRMLTYGLQSFMLSNADDNSIVHNTYETGKDSVFGDDEAYAEAQKNGGEKVDSLLESVGEGYRFAVSGALLGYVSSIAALIALLMLSFIC